MEKVGDRIRRLRKARNLTQNHVAKAIGITQGSYAQIELGSSKAPSAVTLTRLARFFEVDPEWLMTGKGAQSPVEALTEGEAELVLLFRALSSAGQGYILGRAKAIHLDEHHQKTPLRRSSDKPQPDKPGKDGH